MSDEYQLRKDVDRLIDDIYGVNSKFVPFAEDSQLRGIFTNETNAGTIDALLEYYHVLDGSSGGGGGDLSEYVRKEDLIDNTKYDIDLNLSFGLKGIDDTIIIDMDIVDHIVNKEINLRGD